MGYDPWELEGRMRERRQRLRVEIERIRRLAVWRAHDDIRDDARGEPRRSLWERIAAAVVKLVRRNGAGP